MEFNEKAVACILLLLFNIPVNAIDKPVWLDNPNLTGHISAVACAEQATAPTPNLRQKVALALARRDLAQILQTTVQAGSINKTTILSDGSIKNDSLHQIRQETSRQLQNSFIKQQWTNPQNSTECIWLVLPIITSPD